MYAAPDNRAATCALTICLQIAMVSTGCVEVTDLREDEPVADVPVGQIDTGWADTSGRIACTEKSDCPQGECGTSICNASGICITSPIKDGQPCSDGDPNTVGDLCIDGLCVPGSDVCICEDDNECLPFGNGNQCDGRLICDGCACIPVETPPGTACDDDNPLTVGDSCDANNTCVGTPLCECNVATDCTPEPCKETTCDGCACTQHPAELGYIYSEESFAAGIPASWTATSTSDTVFWRQASGGLRVGDSTGLYSGPAVTAELTAEPIFVPNTTVLLEVDLALYSAETGCDDRLEVYVDDKLTDTVCGPTPTTRRRYEAHPNDQGATSVRFVFHSDSDENDAAGPLIGPVRWIRARWDTCGLLPPERVAPSSLDVAEYSPTVGAYGSTIDVFWATPTGVFHRIFVDDGFAVGSDILLDDSGEQPVASGEYALWARPEDNTLAVYRATTGAIESIAVEDPIDGYDLDSTIATPAIAWRTTANSPTAPHKVFVRVGEETPTAIGPSLMPHAPRVILTGQGTRVLVSEEASMLVYSPGGGSPVTLPIASGVQPNIAPGHGGYAIVATTPDGIWLGATGQETLLAANSVIAVDLAAHDTGWYVLWTSRSPNETNVFMAGTTTELGELVAITPPVSEYTFANQDSPQFSTAPSGLWATWRTDWFDGDSSTVVFRNVLKASP